MPVAETFTFEDEEGNSLSQIADLDTMVTVIDAGNFMKDFGSWDDLTDVIYNIGILLIFWSIRLSSQM